MKRSNKKDTRNMTSEEFDQFLNKGTFKIFSPDRPVGRFVDKYVLKERTQRKKNLQRMAREPYVRSPRPFLSPEERFQQLSHRRMASISRGYPSAPLLKEEDVQVSNGKKPKRSRFGKYDEQAYTALEFAFGR